MIKVGLLGYPLSHSFSKKLFNCLRDNFGFLIEYENFSVPSGEVDQFFQFALENLHGFNITVPYKEKPFEHSEIFKIDEVAAKIGAVNVTKRINGGFEAYNTDHLGFIKPIMNFKFRSALIFGAGGAARAVIYALINHGVEKIRVFNRTRERALKLKKKFQLIEVLEERDIKDALLEADIVVNATSLGLHEEAFHPLRNLDLQPNLQDKIFYDLIYNPPVTDFLRYGNERGAMTVNGLKMLLFQAVENIKIWTGENSSTEVIKCSEFLQQENPTENI